MTDGALGVALGGAIAIAIAGALLLAAFAVGALFHSDGARTRNRWRASLYGGAAVLALVSAIGRTPAPVAGRFTPPMGRAIQPQTVRFVTTAYCRAGRTASGDLTRHGTIAATLPFGTRMRVPGYGSGTVLDRGGLVGPGHLDVYLKSCPQAKTWGRRTLAVQIYPRA